MLGKGVVLQNRYRIVSSLGQGGMGAIYRAWHLSLNIPIAIKEMTPQPGLAPQKLIQLRQQFQQEAAVLARLSHPNLVRVIDHFEEGARVYLVMDFVDGESLEDRIKREGALPENEVLAWADQLLDALAYCHAQGVIHRDIKPQNVIIRPDGQAILVDFGLVKLWNPNDPHTRTAMRGMGTLEYAPPEQYGKQPSHTTPRSDIYGLGATLYHALTGKAPMAANDRMAALSPFPSVQGLNPRVRKGTSAAISRAMELQVPKRFDSATEMRAALKNKARALGGVLNWPRTLRAIVGLVALTACILVALQAVDGGTVLPVPTSLPTSTVSPTSTPRSTDLPTLTIAPTLTRQPTAMPTSMPTSIPTTIPPLPAGAVVLVTHHGRYVTAMGEADNWLLRQEPELSDCGQFTLLHMDEDMVALVTCHGMYVTAPATGTTDLDWALRQEPRLSSCGQFALHDQDGGRVAFETCSHRYLTALDGGRSLDDQWVIMARMETALDWEQFTLQSATPECYVSGETWTRPGGAAMVCVPAGEFEMGTMAGGEEERPVHTVALDSFWIDRTEVTNAQYARCVAAGMCEPPAESRSSTRDSYYGDGAYDNYPVIYVDWHQAVTYCTWAGGRLPTEAEWEYAARGPEGRIYPWGSEFDGALLNICDVNCPFDWKDETYDDGYADTAPVGSYPEGASWCGALDIVGNVWAWTADWYGPYSSAREENPTGPASGEARVLRGGSFGDDRDRARCSFRGWLEPNLSRDHIGLRCVLPVR